MVTSTRSHSGRSWIPYQRRRVKTKVKPASVVIALVISWQTIFSPTLKPSRLGGAEGLSCLCFSIRIWRAVKMPEGALGATPTATIWQESNVFCQKSSGGEKIKHFKWWVLTATRLASLVLPATPPVVYKGSSESLSFWLNILFTVLSKSSFFCFVSMKN